jgi:hypothetical protein
MARSLLPFETAGTFGVKAEAQLRWCLALAVAPGAWCRLRTSPLYAIQETKGYEVMSMKETNSLLFWRYGVMALWRLAFGVICFFCSSFEALTRGGGASLCVSSEAPC